MGTGSSAAVMRCQNGVAPPGTAGADAATSAAPAARLCPGQPRSSGERPAARATRAFQSSASCSSPAPACRLGSQLGNVDDRASPATEPARASACPSPGAVVGGERTDDSPAGGVGNPPAIPNGDPFANHASPGGAIAIAGDNTGRGHPLGFPIPGGRAVPPAGKAGTPPVPGTPARPGHQPPAWGSSEAGFETSPVGGNSADCARTARCTHCANVGLSSGFSIIASIPNSSSGPHLTRGGSLCLFLVNAVRRHWQARGPTGASV